jgi:hypothetical protein
MSRVHAEVAQQQFVIERFIGKHGENLPAHG